ncbi:MAG: CDP-alcohol phosphatidyltransferase family protein [Clostridia bacterium]|nr:CDP-alcohol phosphatidyltransferase family protein [Clostridia bacterium]
MTGQEAGAGRHRRDRLGRREEENPFTVFLIDPVAVPLTGLLAARGRIRPNDVTSVGLALGLAAGPLLLLGLAGPASGAPELGVLLPAGGVAFYLALVADCVDGKLAHRTGRTSEAGRRLEALADRLRVLSAWAGLLVGGLEAGDRAVAAAMVAYLAVPLYRALRARSAARSGRVLPDPGRYLGDRLAVPPSLRRRRVGVWFGSWDRTAICFALAPVLGPELLGPVAAAAVAFDLAWVAAGAWLLRRDAARA